MSTRAEIRALARVKLEDTSASPLWSDSDLNAFAQLALLEYGRWQPVTSVATSLVSAGATSIAYPAIIPDGSVTKLMDGTGATIAPNERAGLQPSLNVYLAQGWRSWARVLYLVRPVAAAEAGTWGVEYLGRRDLPAADGDPMPIEFGHEPVVVQLIVAEALARRAVEDYKRGAKPSTAGAAGEARDLARQMFTTGSRRARGGTFDVA